MHQYIFNRERSISIISLSVINMQIYVNYLMKQRFIFIETVHKKVALKELIKLQTMKVSTNLGRIIHIILLQALKTQ